MKVLIVHNRYRSAQPSGENAVVLEEAALLEDAGLTVERLEVESDDIASWSPVQRAMLPGRIVWSHRGSTLVRNAISTFRPDVVHFHNTFPLLSPAAVRAAYATRTPVVLTMHNFRPLCANASFIRHGQVCEECLHLGAPVRALKYGCYRDSRLASAPLVAMSAVHRGLRTWTSCVDGVVLPSAFARDKYVAAGWPEELLAVKHNTARESRGARTGAGEGFVAVARLSIEKGIDVLVDAWRLAFPNGEERLSIIGSGEDSDALHARADGAAGLTFLGALSSEETRRRLAEARALVVPSRCYEVFPRAIVEAYSDGVPVIASRIGALVEVVSDSVTGLLVEPESPESLAAALQRLSADASLATELGAGARAAYTANLAPAPTTERLLAIYNDALRKSQPARAA